MNTEIAIQNIVIAILMFGLSLPLVKRKVKMNKWYGFRFSMAFKSEENWFKINEYGGKLFIIWSIPLFISGTFIFILPPLSGPILWIAVFAPLIVLIPCIQCFIFGLKL